MKIKSTEIAKPGIIVVCGPTAVGKTALGVDIALRFGGEVINSDSRQFFQELNIGTAKPQKEEMRGVPHHFIDHLSISQTYTAGQFENEALNKISDLHAQNILPVVVGGSGLYIKALLEGLDDLPSNEKLRNELNLVFQKEGIEPLIARLDEKDPDYAARIDRANHIRLIRALEIVETSGKTMAQMQFGQPKKRNFDPFLIALSRDRKDLYEAINKRVNLMMESGLLEEARSVYPYRSHQALKTVGYAELFDYFDGNIGLNEAVEKIKQNSRRYAKRQLTWFRGMDNMHWYSPVQTEEILSDIEAWIDK